MRSRRAAPGTSLSPQRASPGIVVSVAWFSAVAVRPSRMSESPGKSVLSTNTWASRGCSATQLTWDGACGWALVKLPGDLTGFFFTV